ncbi:zinc finger, CCHC-type containing protein [Tanacetum coccineum]
MIWELIYSYLYDLNVIPLLGNKKYFVTFIDDSSRFCYVSLLHNKDEALDKLKEFKTEFELQQGSLIKRFRIDRGGEYMDTLYFQSVGIIHETNAPYTLQQNGISKRENRVLEEMVNFMFSYSGLSQEFWGEAMAVVRLPAPKLKTLGKRGIECIFVGYAEHSRLLVPRPSLRISNGTEDIGGLVVPKEVTEEDDPKIFDEAMKSQDIAFWKEAINDEMHSIMGNNTWVLVNLPLGYKPLGCKWIFKRKLKVDGTIKKFKARLVIQGFKQKSWIYYFDTYAPMARISAIRLLIAMASIQNLIIHQMDVKTTFLNGDLDEEVYMNQPQGFIMPSNENKVCKLIKSLYGLKRAPKKFVESGKGVIICLYVDDMLIFGTDQVQVNLTKEFLSSMFFMKDMGEADVIFGIRIKYESNRIAISQSYYIEKALKKFTYFDCTPVSTPMDTSEKLMPNNGQAVSQLEYSRVIGCLMYAMTCTRPGIAFTVGKLSRYTSNLVLEGYTDASWISNTEDNSSTSGWIPLWSKPIAPISIRCDSAATLAKAYSQMYNGKSRHLGVRHSMIRELITNGVISIEFVRSQQNLADHLTKGLARDLVLKSTE